jgi:PleD family two-component response regulator
LYQSRYKGRFSRVNKGGLTRLFMLLWRLAPVYTLFIYEFAMPPRSQILIVDDDEGITTLREYLARFGLESHVAGNGTAMREQLAAHRIDLVVLDLMLPGEDGWY